MNLQKGFHRLAKNIKLSGISLEDVTYVSKEVHDEIFSRCAPEFGDVLLTKDGTIGEATVNNLNYPFSMLSSVALIKPSNWLLSWYLVYVLKSSHFQKQMKGNAKGSALKRIILAQINSFLIPFPPIKEQKQIVTKIEEIFSQINCLEIGKDELKTAIKHAKSKILDLAIHGKLVPQDPSEEPASKLLEKIRAEKEAKIAAGELKRDKNDSYIYKNPSDNCHYRKYANEQEENIESEIPFELPENWIWCQLGTIAFEMADGPFGSDLKKEHYTDRKEARIIQLSNIGEGVWREENTKYTTFEHAKVISRSIVKPGTLVIAKMMPAGRTIICPDKEAMYVLSSDSIRCSHSELVDKEYLLRIINSTLFRKKIADDTQGTTRARTNIAKLKAGIFPLPPLAEQKRIVSKIEEIFSNLDEIVENLS